MALRLPPPWGRSLATPTPTDILLCAGRSPRDIVQRLGLRERDRDPERHAALDREASYRKRVGWGGLRPCTGVAPLNHCTRVSQTPAPGWGPVSCLSANLSLCLSRVSCSLCRGTSVCACVSVSMMRDIVCVGGSWLLLHDRVPCFAARVDMTCGDVCAPARK